MLGCFYVSRKRNRWVNANQKHPSQGKRWWVKSIQAEGGRCERKVIGEFKSIQAKERDGWQRSKLGHRQFKSIQVWTRTFQNDPSHEGWCFKMIQARQGRGSKSKASKLWVAWVFFVFGRDLLYWLDAMGSNSKASKLKVGDVRGGECLDSKWSKPERGSRIKMIQAKTQTQFKKSQAGEGD